MSPSDKATPAISVVIPVFERWQELDACLASLEAQVGAPPFEVVVVDDGSREPIPGAIKLRGQRYLDLKVVRQAHAGPSSARNTGVAHARGAMLAFVDSDVRVTRRYLRAVVAGAEAHPQVVAFQGNLSGCTETLTHRMEHVRLRAVQSVLRQPDGSIPYVNTSAFSVRCAYAMSSPPLFDPGVLRGEDSLILARLVREGRSPQFLELAAAVHCPRLPLRQYMIGHWHIGYRTRKARTELTGAKGIRLTLTGRLRMLRELFRTASDVGYRVVGLVLVAYAIEICGRVGAAIARPRRAAARAGEPRSEEPAT